jgi:HSP20 family molecular chaperone IbpA
VTQSGAAMTDELRAIPFRLGFHADLVERTFARLIHEPWGAMTEGWVPAVDLFETAQAYVISLEIPGVPVESVEIRAEGATLTISGERREVRLTNSSRAVRLERTSGRFSRTLQLDWPVDLNRMEMDSENGVLHVRLPKIIQTSSP